MNFKKLKKYRYILLTQRKDNFGNHNGYTKGKPKVIYAEDREAAKTELDTTLKGKLYKLLLF